MSLSDTLSKSCHGGSGATISERARLTWSEDYQISGGQHHRQDPKHRFCSSGQLSGFELLLPDLLCRDDRGRWRGQNRLACSSPGRHAKYDPWLFENAPDFVRPGSRDRARSRTPPSPLMQSAKRRDQRCGEYEAAPANSTIGRNTSAVPRRYSESNPATMVRPLSRLPPGPHAAHPAATTLTTSQTLSAVANWMSFGPYCLAIGRKAGQHSGWIAKMNAHAISGWRRLTFEDSGYCWREHPDPR